jgi:hypothetical protein
VIRFIDLGKQIAVDETDPDYPREFAFFDTVSGEFINLCQMGHVWDSWTDIMKHADDLPIGTLERMWNVSPEWARGGVKIEAA